MTNTSQRAGTRFPLARDPNRTDPPLLRPTAGLAAAQVAMTPVVR
jgi:hypothetical protein